MDTSTQEQMEQQSTQDEVAGDLGSLSSTQATICKHWRRSGSCAWGPACRFLHPPEMISEAQVKCRRTKKKGNAKVVMKGSRAFAFRRFIQDQFFDLRSASQTEEGDEGIEEPATRSPVRIVDVAGGQGELSFELLNASALIADGDGSDVIVIDPRPSLRFDSFVRRWERGMYAWNEVWREKYNSRAPSRGTQDPLHPTDNLRMPVHWRVHCEPPLVDAMRRFHTSPAPNPCGASTPELSGSSLAWWTDNLARAAELRDLHVDDDGDAAVRSSEPTAQASVDLRSGCARAPVSAMPRRAAGPPQGDQDPERLAKELAGLLVDQQSQVQGAYCLPDKGTPGCKTLPDPSAPAKSSLQDFLRSLGPGAVSVMVGMHPDEATEPMVDIALLLQIPFAVVPCCVFPRSNPHRRLRSGGGVSSYEEFVQFLMEKDPRIARRTLDFEGRNVVLFMTEAMFARPEGEPATAAVGGGVA